ncbi:hypothetical protein [Cryobacterium aureum]|uniref:hypothetical protein n=1 Tax=Cryobacterium aureum TaxID=995037 RepID=UPI000CF50CFF|nr:hypothetical protein [Cryobacterium aureum]
MTRTQPLREEVLASVADLVGNTPLVNPILTANAAATESVRAHRAELSQAAIDEALQGVSCLSGVDFKACDLDEPLP